MPEARTNAGYIITDAIRVGNEEFVLGELINQSGFKQYVTWRCANGDYYYSGNYFLNRNDAMIDLCIRTIKQTSHLTRENQSV